MALPSFCYRDPMIVLEQKQEHELRKTCNGCVHAFKIEFGGSIEQGCNKGKKYGTRCKLFQEEK